MDRHNCHCDTPDGRHILCDLSIRIDGNSSADCHCVPVDMSILDVRPTPHDSSHSLRMDSVSSPDLFRGKQLFGLIVIYQSGVNKSRRSTGMVQTVRITNVQRHTNISFSDYITWTLWIWFDFCSYIYECA